MRQLVYQCIVLFLDAADFTQMSVGAASPPADMAAPPAAAALAYNPY